MQQVATWAPYIGGALTALVGGIVALLATWLTQRASHAREREARRRSILLDVYAEWAGTLAAQFKCLVRVVWKVQETPEPPKLDEERAALWREIFELDHRRLVATHKLRLLEPDAGLREKIKAVAVSSEFWKDRELWEEFVQLMPSIEGEPDPPYGKKLRELLDLLETSGALR